MTHQEKRIVCKFGGTSLADAAQIRKVVGIMQSDKSRKVLVPSAPGKAHSDDVKVTDLLLLCHELKRQGVEYSGPFTRIIGRYRSIVEDLSIDIDISALFEKFKNEIDSGAGRAYIASRGEYFSGLLLSHLLDADFVDAADVIRFLEGGRMSSESYRLIAGRVDPNRLTIIPGFYGSDAEGTIVTFPRGGSDITGAVVARAIKATVYENWTDVSGMLMADPRIVPGAKAVREVTYREIRELSYMGASVFNTEAMFPVREVGIPVNIRNTNLPEEQGTLILPKRKLTDRLIAGVAGKPNFSMIYIEKSMMNQEKGFGKSVLEIVASFDISYEHTPSGIDSMSLIISDEELDGKTAALVDDLKRKLEPDRVDVYPNLALIATVGEGMSHRIGIAARLFTALSEAEVSVRVIDQGASEINIIVGVEAQDCEKAVRALYHAFVE